MIYNLVEQFFEWYNRISHAQGNDEFFVGTIKPTSVIEKKINITRGAPRVVSSSAMHLIDTRKYVTEEESWVSIKSLYFKLIMCWLERLAYRLESRVQAL